MMKYSFGASLDQYEELPVGPGGTETVCIPKFTAETLPLVKEEVIQNRNKHLIDRPIDEIIEVIDAVSRKWLDKNYRLRKQALKELPLITGYSSEMIDFILDYFPSLYTKDEIYNMLKAEIGDPKYLDEFRPREGQDGLMKAFGPELVLTVNAGNVPAIPLGCKNINLLLKSAQIGKVAHEEPVFSFLYDESIAEEDPGIASTMADGYWKGGDSDIEREAFKVPVVIVFGGPASIEEIRQKYSSEMKLITHGHKWGFGAIGREYLTKKRVTETAHDAALATSLYDQLGCLSPQMFWVEEGGEVSPEEFGEYLAKAMDEVSKSLPRGAISLDTAATISQLRETYQFRSLSEDGLRIWSSKRTDWTVIYEKNPAFSPSCMYRFIRIKPVGDINEIPELVKDSPFLKAEYLQTVGAELPKERKLKFADQMGKLGAARITSLKGMGVTKLGPHDRRYALSELIEWTVIQS